MEPSSSEMRCQLRRISDAEKSIPRYMSHVNCDPVDLVFSTTLLQKAFVAVGKLVACVTWHMSQ